MDQTGQPYEYAGDDPVSSTDPGGQSSADTATNGYYLAFPQDHDGLIKDAIKHDFIAADRTGNTYHDVTGSGDTGFADLISFSPVPDLQGNTFAEIYDVVQWLAGPESLLNSGCFGQGRLCSPTDIASFYSPQLRQMQDLQQHASTLLYYTNARPPTGSCYDRAPRLYFGLQYPYPMATALSQNLLPEQTGNLTNGRAHYVNTSLEGTPARVFARLAAPGLIGYMVCTRGHSGGSYLNVLSVPCPQLQDYSQSVENCSGNQDASSICVPALFVVDAFPDPRLKPVGVLIGDEIPLPDVEIPADDSVEVAPESNISSGEDLVQSIEQRIAQDGPAGTAEITVDGEPETITLQQAETVAEATVARDLLPGMEAEEEAIVESERGPAVRGAVEGANFAQNVIRRDEAFSDDGQRQLSELAPGTPIRTVSDLVNALKAGRIKASQLPIDYVDINGTRLILNTRTSTALLRAGVPRSDWFGRDVTGQNVPGLDVTFDQLARDQLKSNRLPSTGSPTVKG